MRLVPPNHGYIVLLEIPGKGEEEGHPCQRPEEETHGQSAQDIRVCFIALMLFKKKAAGKAYTGSQQDPHQRIEQAVVPVRAGHEESAGQ